MTETQRASSDPDKRHEAENLAKEALEELRHGNKDEGNFLAGEARELDPAAADGVLKQQHRKSGDDAKTPGRSQKSRSAAASGSRSKLQHGGGHAAERTTDHDTIRAWMEERNGRPSVVKRSHDTAEGGGILHIDFNEPEESLEEVSWDEFFETFDDRELAFLYQDRTADGKLSRFFKFVRRDEAEG